MSRNLKDINFTITEEYGHKKAILDSLLQINFVLIHKEIHFFTSFFLFLHVFTYLLSNCSVIQSSFPSFLHVDDSVLTCFCYVASQIFQHAQTFTLICFIVLLF